MLKQFGKWNRVYSQLEGHFVGKSKTGGATYGWGFVKPTLAFDYGRTSCLLHSQTNSVFKTGKLTQMAMLWPDPNLKLQITTLVNSKMERGAKEILPFEFKEIAFNSRFSVRTNQLEAANKALNYNVQSLLIRLLMSTYPHELNISIKRGKLIIQKPGFLKDLLPLDNFIRYSLDIFDQLMLISTDGLDFLNENNATILESITCPICSGRITEQMVLCIRCKTPHCRDCWEYNRQCATFACQGTSYFATAEV
ncbi:hypothetical protein N9B46_03850 [Mariniblastus sp.]|nr:hypothetical protein [Mariniblastus sp.]